MRRIFAALLAIGMILPLCASAAEKGELPDPEGKILPKLTEKDLKDLANTAFVEKDSKGTEWLFIRLTKVQYVHARTKMPVKSQKGQGGVRLILQPRQMLAIKRALQLSETIDKGQVIVRVDTKHMHYFKGLRAYYIIRSTLDFRKLLTTPTKEEEQPPANQPDTKFVEKLTTTKKEKSEPSSSPLPERTEEKTG